MIGRALGSRAARRAALIAAVAALASVLLWWLGADALARPGGGSSYSGGGGGSSGGGGGGGGGELVYLLIRLIVVYPYVGIPVAIGVVVIYVKFKKEHDSVAASDWDSMAAAHKPPAPPLESLIRVDQNFSPVLFEDFMFRLYAQTHRLRGRAGGLDELAPYLDAGPRATLAQHEPVGDPVEHVIVGSMRTTEIVIPPSPTGPDGEPYYLRVGLEFESNFILASGRTMYAHERWGLTRATTATSKPPGQTQSFPCPNCGAKFTSSDGQTCDYCQTVVSNGRFDWLVYQIDSLRLLEKPPALTTNVAEVGTDAPTVSDRNLMPRLEDLRRDDPSFSDERFAARLNLIYHELNVAWTNHNMTAIRAFVSDGLFDYLRYWIEAYRKAKLRNVLENMQLRTWRFAKLVRDRYYDALTVRIWGVGIDYTAREDGKRLSGSKRKPREYSEYWTFIRARGGQTSAERGDKACPNCGAALQIAMGGNCEYCGAHVTAGEFDWVLSKIEQDESYTG